MAFKTPPVLDRLICWTNREPILTVRVWLWIIFSGWWLALFYAFAAVGMCMTVVFIPFGLKAFWFVILAFNPVKKEAFKEGVNPDGSAHSEWKAKYYLVANIVWLVIFGWGAALMHLMAAIIQACTIIGIGTAITNLHLMMFALWPFGQGIRSSFLPTTVEELRNHEAAVIELETRAKRGYGPQFGRDIV